MTDVLRRDRRLRDHRADRRPRSTSGVAEDEVLRPLYPEEDLGPAEERFTLFLVQYWGGPTTYSDQRGHPRLRMRHAPFAVTPRAKEHWLRALPRRARLGRAARRSRTRSSGTTSPTRRSSWSTPWSEPRPERRPSSGSRSRAGPLGERRWVSRSKKTTSTTRPGEHLVAVADLGLDDHRARCRRATIHDQHVVRLGPEQDRPPVVHVGLRHDHADRPRAAALAPRRAIVADPRLLEVLEVLHVVDVAVDVDVGEPHVDRVVAVPARGAPADAARRLRSRARGTPPASPLAAVSRRGRSWRRRTASARSSPAGRPGAARRLVVVEDLVGHRERRRRGSRSPRTRC